METRKSSEPTKKAEIKRGIKLDPTVVVVCGEYSIISSGIYDR